MQNCIEDEKDFLVYRLGAIIWISDIWMADTLFSFITLDVDECSVKPCEHIGNSYCIDGIHNYSCNCVPGYEGKNCSISEFWQSTEFMNC